MPSEKSSENNRGDDEREKEKRRVEGGGKGKNVRSERQKHRRGGEYGIYPSGSERSDDRLGFRSVDAFWINRSETLEYGIDILWSWTAVAAGRFLGRPPVVLSPSPPPLLRAAEPRGSGESVKEGGRMVRLHILFRHDRSPFASFIALSRPRKTFLYRLPKCPFTREGGGGGREG